jgi:hypothetical protein
MINQLQPLAVSINKPFKHLVRKHYDAWPIPSGKTRRVSASTVVEQITTWKRVPANIIPKSSSNSCLSNAEDGMQMTFLGTTVKKAAGVHRLQKMQV